MRAKRSRVNKALVSVFQPYYFHGTLRESLKKLAAPLLALKCQFEAPWAIKLRKKDRLQIQNLASPLATFHATRLVITALIKKVLCQ